MSYVLLLTAVVFFVFLNGFFVAAEFALVRSRRSRMEQLAEEGQRGAALALKQIDRIDEYLSACQLGITMASLAIGFLGEPAIADLFRELVGEPLPHEVTLAIAVGVAYLITTALHITIGEQVPKIYAIVHAEPIARRTARGLELFFVVMRPGIHALNTVSNGILRLFRTDPRAEFDEAQNAEELKLLIAQSAHGGTLDPGEAGMLSGVFHLHEQEARQVMTPIPAVVTVDMSEKVETALRRAVDSGHTRLLVTEEGNTDRIQGIVHSGSLARLVLNQGPDASVAPLVKDALIVP